MHDINNEQMSPELSAFVNTLPKNKIGSNVYEIIVEDIDGNIVDRKFGVNLMVDGDGNRNNGFQHQWVGNGNYNAPYVVIGTGTGIPQYTDYDLFNRLPITPICLAETVYGDGQNTQGCIFDRDTGNIIGRRKTGQFVIDYNYDGIDENVHITEYGECACHQTTITSITGMAQFNDSDWNKLHLHTHCLVYDENHDPSYFIKRIDQKVTVSVYRACMINASVINNLWAQGKYMFIWPPHLIRANNNNDASRPRYSYIICGRCRSENDFPLYESSPNLWGNKDYDGGNGRTDLNVYANSGYGRNGYAYPSSCELSAAFNTKHGTEYWYRNNGTHSEFLMNNKYQSYGMRVVDCWGMVSDAYKMRDIWFMFEKINLTEPEEMVFNNAFTDSCFHTRFNNCFGLAHVLRNEYFFGIWDRASLPVNDFHITACKRYNYLTDDYDIIEQFTDDPDYDFRNPERGFYGYYYDNSPDHVDDIPKSYNVFLNITDVPIIGFRESNAQRIWMTDAYWDTTTFVEVLDFDNVPQSLQHKKYIIKTPDQVVAGNDTARAYGIHTIREPNNHALIPSTPIINVDLPETITLRDYGNRNGNQNAEMYFNMIYSSDDGWIICENRLIYPESDDGTGHPYMYTLFPTLMGGPSSYDFRYIRYTDHHIIAPDNRQYMKPTDTTNPRFIVVTPDPTHPEIDPMTTAVNYYDPDIMACFGETSQVNAYWDGYVVMFTDPHNDRFYFARGNWDFDAGDTTETHLVQVDLNSPTPSLHIMENTTRFYTSICDFVWGTDYFVWLGENNDSYHIYYIYDLVNEQVIHQCQIERQSPVCTLYGVTGFKDRIYALTYIDNEQWYIRKFDYVNDAETEQSNYGWGYLYYYSIGDYPLRNMQNHAIDYDNETLIIHTAHLQADGNSRYVGFNFRNSLAIFSDDLDHPCFFNVSIENQLFNWAIQYPRIKKMNGGKDYVVLLSGTVIRDAYNTSSYGGRSYVMPWVINIGYIKNKGYRNPSQLVPNTPLHYYRTPTYCYTQSGALGSSNTAWYMKEGKRWWGQFTLYKNYFVSITNLDQYKCVLSPIELLLPHQLTGTTRTINTYNNPKKFSSHSLGMYVTNHLT